MQSREDRDVGELVAVPDWIQGELTVGDLESIVRGGCASGAYMPAVTYYDAVETMSEHGDAVLAFVQDALGELPAPRPDESWTGLAVHYLSLAVEVWAGQALDAIDNTEVAL